MTCHFEVNPMQATPEFVAALEHLQRLSDAGLDQTPEARDAWERVLRLAPREFIALATEKMRELNLLPKPAGLDANGRPVYRVSDVAAKLRLAEDEAQRLADEAVVAGPIQRAH